MQIIDIDQRKSRATHNDVEGKNLAIGKIKSR